MNAGFVVGGYLVPAVGGNLLKGTMGVNLPDELYGIGGMAASEMVVDERKMTIGSDLYVVNSLAQRVGLIQQNFVQKGEQARGFLGYVDLRDSTDNPLPMNSQLVIVGIMGIFEAVDSPT